MPSPNSDYSILLAVDAGNLHAAIKRILVESGHRVHSARDGNAAADAAVRLLPALVISTPDLPHIRGVELLEIAGRARAPLPVAALFLVSPTDSRPLPLGSLVRSLRLPVGADALGEAVEKLLHETLRGAPPTVEVAVEPPSPGWTRELGKVPTTPAPKRRLGEGKLSSRSLASLLLGAVEEQCTAHLHLRTGEVEKRIHLLHGRPVNCDSNLANESLGEMLRAERLVSADDLERANAQMKASDCSQSEALVAVGALDRAALASALERHVRDRIVAAFAWGDAAWRLEEVDKEEIHPLISGLEPLWLVLEGTRRFSQATDLLGFYDEQQDRYPRPSPSLKTHASALAALVGGSRVAESLDGRITFSNLQVTSGLDELLFTQILMSLASGGLVTLEELPLEIGDISWRVSEEMIGASNTAVEEAGRIAAATTEPERPDTDPALKDDVLGLYTSLVDSDPFDLLRVDPDADQVRIATAFAGWAARVGPDRMMDIHDPKLADLGRQVWLRLEEAFEALSDEEARERWRAERRRRLEGGKDRRVRWLDADRAFRAGRSLLEEGRPAAAVEAFRAAEAMNKKEPVYRLYASWAKWLAARDEGDEAVMRRVEEEAAKAVEAIPVLDEGWVFLGEMALHRKDRAAARAHLEKALLFNPGSGSARKALARLELF